MPECAVCGGGEFDLSDGLFFCSECGTQSQVSACSVYDHGRITIDVSTQARRLFLFGGVAGARFRPHPQSGASGHTPKQEKASGQRDGSEST